MTNAIRGINAWLWRSVYGKSRFEQWLAAGRRAASLSFAKLLLPLAAANFPAQAVLFVPMFIANTVAAGVVRRAEHDADRTAARLVGRQTFAALLERVDLIQFTWEGVVAELEFLHREQALPDSLPQQLALRMLDMTPELRAALERNGQQARRKAIRQSGQQSGATRQRSPARSGVVALPASCRRKTLLSGYDKLAREMTWDFYSARFGRCSF